MAKPKTHKTGKISTKDGFEICEYSDGSWRYNAKKGKHGIAIRSPKWRDFTKENAKAMSIRGNEARVAKKQEAIRKAAEAHSGSPMLLPDDAMSYTYGLLWEGVLDDKNKLKARADTAIMIGTDAELVDKQSGGRGAKVQVNIAISDKATAGIEEEDKILDALWVEVDEDL